MSKIVTGADILERIRRDLKTPSNVGAYGDEKLRRFFAEEWAGTWERLGAGDYGIGIVETTITGTGETHPLPADFLYLMAVSRGTTENDRVPGEYTSSKQRMRERPLQPWAQVWRFELLTDNIGDGLKVTPPLTAGETLYVAYYQQPYDMGDPSNPAWDAATLNVISEAVLHYAVARTRLRAVSREDAKEYQRAGDDAQMKMDEFLATRRARQQAAGNGAGRLSDSSRWIGYQ
jgi:hypothetical protein